MEEAIITRLLGDSGVAALAETRVFPGSRPQGSALPALVMNRISGGPEYADDGEVGLEQGRIQIDCWAATYTEAKLLARAVTASLSAFEGTVGDTTFQLIELDIERDLREGGGNSADYPFRTALDFLVWAER
jgi:Protein of unknown function (DUF3168)